MEFPNLGQNCHESTCNQLDFLPMKCDSCSNIFCKDHIRYDQHKCAAGFRKDVQVPVCPLCNKPVPVKRGEAPDIGVSDHIDRECQSDPAVKKRKVYSNRCTKKGCKQRELVPVLCSSCHKNFCLKHRHTVDHDCQGFQNSGKSVSKQGERRERMLAGRQRGVDSTMQAGMSEDEAMARAIQMSLAEENQSSKPARPPVNPRSLQQEDEDLALARALAASEEEERNRRRRQQRQESESDSKCSLS
ncbi:AN1-type zinc finger protein 2A-like isoform X3 [Lytechinus pictus]|uniref:AN1-type zinc finger protein 2A-like isoform X3 n=1 Tax=Lytechinus pictus TaxID=7653 RepID=UPI0030B9E9EF